MARSGGWPCSSGERSLRAVFGHLEGAAHSELTRGQVNVDPLELQQLALSKSGVDSHDVEGFVADTMGGHEKRFDLSGGEGFGFLAVAAAGGRGSSLVYLARLAGIYVADY